MHKYPHIAESVYLPVLTHLWCTSIYRGLKLTSSNSHTQFHNSLKSSSPPFFPQMFFSGQKPFPWIFRRLLIQKKKVTFTIKKNKQTKQYFNGPDLVCGLVWPEIPLQISLLKHCEKNILREPLHKHHLGRPPFSHRPCLIQRKPGECRLKENNMEILKYCRTASFAFPSQTFKRIKKEHASCWRPCQDKALIITVALSAHKQKITPRLNCSQLCTMGQPQQGLLQTTTQQTPSSRHSDPS